MGLDAPWHWIILVIIVAALFGYKRLPEMAKSVARSLRVFKTEMKGFTDDDKDHTPAAYGPPVAAPPAAVPPVVPPVAVPPVAVPSTPVVPIAVVGPDISEGNP